MSDIPEIPKEHTILAHLEYESDNWAKLKHRVERTLGLDSFLLLEQKDHMDRINSLLEELFALHVEVIDGTTV